MPGRFTFREAENSGTRLRDYCRLVSLCLVFRHAPGYWLAPLADNEIVRVLKAG